MNTVSPQSPARPPRLTSVPPEAAPVRPVARALTTVLALSALIGVATSMGTGWVGGPGVTGVLRGAVLTPIDQLRFFTYLSNVLALVTAGQLAILGHTRGTWHSGRMASVICLVITGIVFNVLLDEGGRSGLAAVNNTFVHILTPLLAVLVWLLVGPATSTLRRLLASAILPILWLVATLVRGILTGEWPYTILDPAVVGTGGAAAYTASIFAAFFLIGALMCMIDAIRRRRGAPMPSRPCSG